MTQKQYLRMFLIIGFVMVSLGGWLLHLRIHPPSLAALQNFIPYITGIVSVVILPIMFLNHKTLPYAYVLNGMIVIIGTITMAHFSIAKFIGTLTFSTLFLNTLLPDIFILWTNFAIGMVLFKLEMMKVPTDLIQRGRFWRYPNMGWWWVHLVTLSVVYAAGNILWR